MLSGLTPNALLAEHRYLLPQGLLMLEFTPMTPIDIPAVMEIERQSQLEPWSSKSFLEELARSCSHSLLARLSGVHCTKYPGGVLGYIIYWYIAEEIQILNLAVHPACRGKRIGRALLVRAIRKGYELGARIAVLEVRKSNSVARKLYESVGFDVVGERPGYYGKVKEPAVLMEMNVEAALLPLDDLKLPNFGYCGDD